jgi:hypothetical protein
MKAILNSTLCPVRVMPATQRTNDKKVSGLVTFNFSYSVTNKVTSYLFPRLGLFHLSLSSAYSLVPLQHRPYDSLVQLLLWMQALQHRTTRGGGAGPSSVPTASGLALETGTIKGNVPQFLAKLWK